MARIIGTTGSAPAAKAAPRVKVKAHTRAAPTAKQVNAATNPKPVRAKPVSTAPPQTPDSRDNNAAARHPNVSHVSPDAADVAGRSPQQHAHDQQVVARVVGQQRRAAIRQQHEQRPSLAGIVRQGLHGQGPAKNQLAASELALKAIGVLPDPNQQVLHDVVKAAKNAPGDAAELAVTTPSSAVKLASDVIHHPAKVPGELLAPYKQLAANPEKFATTHPVSTALMVAPAVRMPGRVLGKVARVAGKQTLERPAATLPGTALREARTGSRDAVARAVQGAVDTRKGARTMTVRMVQRRVDEAFGAQHKHRERVTSAIMRDAHKTAKALPKAARAAHLDDARAAAAGAAKEQAQRAYVREFGALHRVTPAGHVMAIRPKPGVAVQGVLHDSLAEAQKVADHLNLKPVSIKLGGFTRAEKALPLAHQTRPVTFVTHKAGDKYGVIPDFVSKRIIKQEKVGSSKAPLAKGLRMTRGMFTRAVLPYRPTWLTGQGVEGVIRSAVAGAGPTSYLRGLKIAKAMEHAAPGSGKGMLERTVPGGKIGRVYKDTADLEHAHQTFAGEFPDNPVAHALTSLGRTPGVKQVRQLHHAVSSAVFTHLNGNFLERIPQTAMLGKALKNSPLMERSVIGLSDRAIQDAAKGLQATENQVQLARAVQRMYGKYSNFGPLQREAILHWTPFIPWLVSSGRFLASVLPQDHPIAAALDADISAAEEQWRKAHNLSMRQPNHVPFYMMGGYPHNGSTLEVAHYTPWGAAQDPSGGLAGLVLPQFSGAYGAVQYGVDWKGKALMHGGPHGVPYTAPEKWLYALTQLGEAMVPLASQAAAVAGAKDKGAALKKQFRVMASVSPKKDTTSGSAVFVKPTYVKPIFVAPIK